MSTIIKIFDSVYNMLIVLAKIILLVMVLVVSAAVFARFVLNTGIKWSDEVALISMVWFTFIGLVIGVKRNLHICIEVLVSKLPRKINKILDKSVNVICAFLGAVMVIYGVKLVGFTMTSTLPATGLPSAVLYSVVPISGVFVAYYSMLRLFGLYNSNDEEKNSMEGGRENA